MFRYWDHRQRTLSDTELKELDSSLDLEHSMRVTYGVRPNYCYI